MAFVSVSFLFLFLPAVLAAYFIVPAKYTAVRNFVLLGCSLLFYVCGEQLMIFVLLISAVGNYLFALSFERYPRMKKALLVASVIFNVGLLSYFKYTEFFFENLNLIGGIDIKIPEIVVPMGMSFFTFCGMSYVFDVYRKACAPQKNILNIASYITMFPYILSGPIVRYGDIGGALISRKITLDGFAYGVRRFIAGFGKKMLLANTMNIVAADIFSKDPSGLSAPLAWIGAVAYSFQIFFDFSGYSDMAIGTGYMLGFKFPENFNYPYIARSITEFWTRWHMSLSSWFRDYVYIPLGGNRRGLPRQILNILIVWLLTGIWHGAAWNFIFWGLYFAAVLIMEKMFLGKLLKKTWRPLSHIYALFFIIIGWVIFNGSGASFIARYIGAMFGAGSIAEGLSGHAVYLITQYKAEFALCLICSVPLIRLVPEKIRTGTVWRVAANLVLLAVFALSVIAVVNSTFSAFIYFRF